LHSIALSRDQENLFRIRVCLESVSLYFIEVHPKTAPFLYQLSINPLSILQVLKTKSEISAVKDFVQWLESFESENIILITHETRKTVPLFLLEVLKKYNLYERFCKVVKGFANTYLFAESKCRETVKSYSLYSLCTVLLDKEEDLDNALDRARLTYQVPTIMLYLDG